MIKILPVNLFYGKDIYMDIISTLVLLAILYYSIKFYKINKKQIKYKYLITSFSLLALSFLFKILSHFIIYYSNVKTRQIGIIKFTYQAISQSHALIYWGLMLYRALSIFALFYFYKIYSKKTEKLTELLIFYLLIIASLFGHFKYIFYHITTSILLILILLNLFKKYYKDKTKKPYKKNLAIGFTFLLTSQLTFIFLAVHPLIYFFGESIQLTGYLIILCDLYKVISNAKKKR